jgi:hypothetical protein
MYEISCSTVGDWESSRHDRWRQVQSRDLNQLVAMGTVAMATSITLFGVIFVCDLWIKK